MNKIVGNREILERGVWKYLHNPTWPSCCCQRWTSLLSASVHRPSVAACPSIVPAITALNDEKEQVRRRKGRRETKKREK